MTIPSTKSRSWTHNSYLISTDPTLISLSALNLAFSSNQLNWAKPLPIEELKVMVSNSVCFGVYTKQADSSSRSMIGFARIITDYVTLAYLTDVYILPEYQNQGLGSWLMDCVKEWVDLMPNMRSLVLVTSEGKNELYYAEKLGTGRKEDGGSGYRILCRAGPGSAALHR